MFAVLRKTIRIRFALLMLRTARRFMAHAGSIIEEYEGPAASDGPILALFRQWERTYHSAGHGITDEERAKRMAICSDLERQMMGLPSKSASDVAAKLIVATEYGESEPGLGWLFAEALYLTGATKPAVLS